MNDVPPDDLPGRPTPSGVSDDTIDALGKLSEALETCDRARGHLYSFHQLTGSSDIELGEAVEALRKAGHDEIADRIDRELVGRNVLQGQWTFQIVEDYDDNYWSLFRDAGEVRPRRPGRWRTPSVRGSPQAERADRGIARPHRPALTPVNDRATSAGPAARPE